MVTPMDKNKLRFTNDWLKEKINEEPDNMEVEVGTPMMDKSKAIEARANAIYLAWRSGQGGGRGTSIVEIVEQSLLASGFAIVPVEATEEMSVAGGEAFQSEHQNTCYPQAMDGEKYSAAEKIYRAMIAACKERTGG